MTFNQRIQLGPRVSSVFSLPPVGAGAPYWLNPTGSQSTRSPLMKFMQNKTENKIRKRRDKARRKEMISSILQMKTPSTPPREGNFDSLYSSTAGQQL